MVQFDLAPPTISFALHPWTNCNAGRHQHLQCLGHLRGVGIMVGTKLMLVRVLGVCGILSWKLMNGGYRGDQRLKGRYDVPVNSAGVELAGADFGSNFNTPPNGKSEQGTRADWPLTN